MEEVCEGKDFSFPKAEQDILKFWDDIDAFKEQLRLSEGKPEYIFYDGPPFATGLPHYGHILAGTIKDVVTRYACSNGYHVSRRFGWDCHGLPVEYEIDQKLGVKSKDDVLKMGIDVYNEECRSIVMRYSKEWEKTVHRLGRWIDFENDYKTLDLSFMESVWWVFKTIYDKGMVYRGFKVMPYSTTCATPLSNFEAGLNYKDVQDPAVMVSFPVVGDADGAGLVAWTTTPWTLPSNLALCVNPAFTYVRARDPKSGKVYIVAESRLPAIPGATPKKGKKGKESEPGWEILAKVVGKDLAGLAYEPLFDYYADQTTAFRVCTDGYVTDDSGTGVVHQAPAFGEDDYRVCLAHGIITKGENVPCPVSDNGCFEAPVTDFLGRHVKEADKDITAAIKAKGRLVDAATLTHSYPFCWRSDTPLIYKAVPSWFVRVEEIRDRLLANNAQTYWVPSYVKEKRFHNWLEGAHDWAVSRSRYWGTPIPVWISDDLEEVVVVGSIAELKELTGHDDITDIHRHFIDGLTIPSRQGKGVLRRVEDVFDCWFESGSMPYGQQHYPFENKELFESNFPANFIAEGLDQTRGWFYTLMVLSTALFDKPAFQNLICNGLVLAADGKKMSKRLKNYPDPTLVTEKYGADALRLYLVDSPVVRAEPLRFKEEGVFSVVKEIFLPWYNAYRFLAQNAIAMAAEQGAPFEPLKADLGAATNVLDRWIVAATAELVRFVRVEMEAYRLYTVAPRLVRFIDDLTNIYVRFNRKRLKGRGGPDDQKMALCTLHHVLLTLCKAMAPFTPFFTEHMYQNLRRVMPGAPVSLHFCDFPPASEPGPGDARIQVSVARMQKVIDLARNIRERHNKPVKLPLREMVVVHTDGDFLADLAGDLAQYVQEEMNVRALVTCDDPARYCTVRAEPEWKVLGKRVGKDMGKVAKSVQQLDAAAVADFEATGRVVVEGHELQEGDIKVVRDFRRPAGKAEDAMDANGDGEVLVVLDLEADQELVDAGVAREVVNRFQKLRKTSGCIAADRVALFYGEPGGEGAGTVARVMAGHAAYLAESLGCSPAPVAKMPPHAVVLGREEVEVADGTGRFLAVLTRPALAFSDGVGAGLRAWLLSRDPAVLHQEAEAAGGRVTVHLDGAPVTAVAGKDFFF